MSDHGHIGIPLTTTWIEEPAPEWETEVEREERKIKEDLELLLYDEEEEDLS